MRGAWGRLMVSLFLPARSEERWSDHESTRLSRCDFFSRKRQSHWEMPMCRIGHFILRIRHKFLPFTFLPASVNDLRSGRLRAWLVSCVSQQGGSFNAACSAKRVVSSRVLAGVWEFRAVRSPSTLQFLLVWLVRFVRRFVCKLRVRHFHGLLDWLLREQHSTEGSAQLRLLRINGRISRVPAAIGCSATASRRHETCSDSD